MVFSLGILYYQQAGVVWWAHIGGFVIGMLICGIIVKRRRLE